MRCLRRAARPAALH
eukprot:SM006735S20133  [mRNA]  locus=s6735:276:320:+ [translate_table: standard]